MAYTWEPYSDDKHPAGKYEILRGPIGDDGKGRELSGPTCVVRVVPWPDFAQRVLGGKYMWQIGDFSGHENTLEYARERAEFAADVWPCSPY